MFYFIPALANIGGQQIMLGRWGIAEPISNFGWADPNIACILICPSNVFGVGGARFCFYVFFITMHNVHQVDGKPSQNEGGHNVRPSLCLYSGPSMFAPTNIQEAAMFLKEILMC